MVARKRPSWILALVVLLGICLLGGAWWLVAAGDLLASRKRAAIPAGTGEEAATSPAEAPAAAAAREALEGGSKPGPQGGDSLDLAGTDTTGVGSIALTVLDDLTSEPIAGVRFEAFSERPTNHVLQRGQTDAHGQATLAGLPEDVIMIETERHPPNCSALTAVWLPRGAERSVVLRAGRGGRVRGRVVNDRGEPIAGVSVLALNAEGLTYDPWVPCAVTDREGRYEVEALIDRPRGVWVVDRAPRPERRLHVTLTYRSGALVTRREVSVREGETKDLEDVVFMRAATLAGRVVDAEDHPIAGALVSANFQRHVVHGLFPGVHEQGRPTEIFSEAGGEVLGRVPGQPGFELQPEEVLTDSEGRFTLGQENNVADCLVLTRDAILQTFPTPYVEPGGRREDLLFRLHPQTVLYPVITDTQGKTISPMQVGPVLAVLRDGKELRADRDFMPDVRFGCLASAIQALRVRASDCQPLVLPVDGKLVSGQRVAIVLERRPTLEVRLSISPDPTDRPKTQDRFGLWVAACVMDPKEKKATPGCCGLGDHCVVPIKDLPKEHVLKVKSDLPYWIYVSNPGGVFGDDARLVFGPFRPGDDVHAIVLPPFKPPKAADQQKQPPPADLARSEPGSLAFTVLDDASRALSTPVSVVLRQAPTFENGPEWEVRSDGSGLIVIPVAPPGSYRAVVRAAGYASAELPCLVETGRRTQLGTVTLSAVPRTIVRVRDWDGSVPRPMPSVIIEPADQLPTLYPGEHGDGQFTFYGEIKAPFAVVVSTTPSGVHHRVRFDTAPLEHEIEIKLPRRFAVRLRVTGIPDQYQIASLAVALHDQQGETLGTQETTPTVEEEARGIRVFQCSLLPGKYRVTAQSAVLALREQDIEVAEDKERQEFTLAVE
jgi:hypothetical protein